jgi:hypothetical protein
MITFISYNTISTWSPHHLLFPASFVVWLVPARENISGAIMLFQSKAARDLPHVVFPFQVDGAKHPE